MSDRIGRAFNEARRASGPDYSTSYQAIGTDFITNFRAIGIKSPEQLQDNFLTLFIWVWSLKDYLKSCFVERGLPGSIVEREADGCRALTFVADIANRAKHGELKSSRSGEFAELVEVGLTVPPAAVTRITVAGPDVAMVVADPEMVEIQAFVATASGLKIDALAVLADAMHCWESRVLPQVMA